MKEYDKYHMKKWKHQRNNEYCDLHSENTYGKLSGSKSLIDPEDKRYKSM